MTGGSRLLDADRGCLHTATHHLACAIEIATELAVYYAVGQVDLWRHTTTELRRHHP